MTKRDEIITYRLGLMAKMAEERYNLLKKETRCEDWYIRIGGESYRAVSLNDKTPLCGFTNRGSNKSSVILTHFKTKQPKLLKDEVWKQKKERRIQSFIIKQALLKNGDLKSILNLNNKYDELIFAFDEVSLGDRNHMPIHRCDILAVGIKQGEAFPILIELKSNRSQTTLIDQFRKFSEEICMFKQEFINLLAKCTGREVKISNKIGKMLIWPSNKQGRKKTITKFHDEEIDVLEYDWDYNNPNSIKFKFYPHNDL